MNKAPAYGRILFPEGDTLRVYVSPIAEFCTARIDEVRSILAILEQQVIRGYHVAGYLSYEAAPAFDPAFQTHRPRELPLLWFGNFRGPRVARAGGARLWRSMWLFKL